MNDAVAEADAAEADLYRLLAPRVRRYGLRHQRDTHAADYLMQNVMALTLEHLRGGQVRQPDREPSVLVMMFYEDKPSEVVTSMLGLTSGNVRVLLHRGTAAPRHCQVAGVCRRRKESGMHPNPAGVLVDFEQLVEYWLDETGTADTERIDMHLLACAAVCP